MKIKDVIRILSEYPEDARVMLEVAPKEKELYAIFYHPRQCEGDNGKPCQYRGTVFLV